MGNAPPLRVWLYSVAMAVAVIALLILYRHLPGDRRDNTMAAQTQRFLDAPVPPGQLQVLALGSSLLWAATPQPMAEQRAAMPGVAWLRMSKRGTGMGHLETGLESLLRHPPHVLVIEENLLLPDLGDLQMDQLREELSHLGKKIVSALSAGKLDPNVSPYWERNDQDGEFTCGSGLVRTTPDQVRQHVDMLRTMYLGASFDQQLIGDLAALARRGVRIVLLELPRSPVIEQKITAQKHYWLMQLKKLLPPADTIRYLAFPAPSQPAMYCDLGHLNTRGAYLFAPWWQAQLQQLRQER